MPFRLDERRQKKCHRLNDTENSGDNLLCQISIDEGELFAEGTHGVRRSFKKHMNFPDDARFVCEML